MAEFGRGKLDDKPLFFPIAESAQPAPATRPAGELLAVNRSGAGPLSLDAKSFAVMPHHDLRVKDHEGKEAVYSGVPLRDILQKAGAPIGNHQLRGPNAALCVLASAADGYRVALALAEVDDDFAERNILVADARDGKPLDAKEGPLRIIAPEDKRPARWIRQLISIDVVAR